LASSNEFSFKPILIFCTLITILIICLVGLGPSMLPLFASFATAYFVFPAIKKMESYGIKREYAILGVFALSTLFYIILGIIFLPRLLNELMNFVRELPQMLERAIDKIEGLGFESRFLSSEDRENVQTQSTHLRSSQLDSVRTQSTTHAWQRTLTARKEDPQQKIPHNRIIHPTPKHT